jgi:multisubunit Na+/H+ antiporter MnhF subunit
MNAYAIVGFVVAFGVSALYAGWTIIESRRIAAQVLALDTLDEQSAP